MPGHQGEITRETRFTRKISKGLKECATSTRLKAVHTGLRMWLTRQGVCLAFRRPWIPPPTSHILGEMAQTCNSGTKKVEGHTVGGGRRITSSRSFVANVQISMESGLFDKLQPKQINGACEFIV